MVNSLSRVSTCPVSSSHLPFSSSPALSSSWVLFSMPSILFLNASSSAKTGAALNNSGTATRASTAADLSRPKPHLSFIESSFYHELDYHYHQYAKKKGPFNSPLFCPRRSSRTPTLPQRA